MELLIYGLFDAVNYEPLNNTYAIRIHHPKIRDNPKLKNSSKYIDIKEYYFSDVFPGGVIESYDIMLNQSLAKEIITDFDKKRNLCDTLLVHCSRGVNRSPAIAIALNDLFELGNDSEMLKRKYDETNWYVYNKLLEVGKEYLGR